MKGFLRYVGWALVLGSSVPAMSVPALAQSGAAQPAAPSGVAPPAPSGLTPLPPISEPPGATPAVAPAAPAAAQPSAAGSARLAVGTAGASGAVDTEVAAAPSDEAGEELPTDPELDEALRWRAQNTWLGPAGGVRVVDAASGPPGTARLQFGFDYFSADEYLYVLDHDEWLGGVLSLSVTPIEHLEAYASLSTHANSNTAGEPVLLQVAGDVVLGAKGFTQILPWLGLGGDLRFLFLNTIGDLGVILKGTSVGFRGLATADLRRIQESVPLVLRANLEYLLDNSGALIDGVEAARYEELDSTRRPIANEDRHLVNRIERFALGINRVDMFTISLGAEAPLQVDDDFFIQPLFEWRIGIPVNRQGYSCLSVATSAGIDGPDSCLAIEGLSAAPSTLTLGARVLPPVRGLSGLLAFDIGLTGASTFVRELAPNRPWAVMFALGYAIDARPAKPQIQYVAAPAAPVAVEKLRVRGTVVERGFGTAIVGAIVRYPDTDLSPQLTNAYGQWISYPFDPGDIVIEITHPDYDPGRCTVKIPAPARAPLPSVAEALQPYAADGTGTAAPAQPGAAPPAAAPPAPPAFIEARCELTAHPRSGALRGSVQDDKNAPVPGVSIEIAGPSPQTVVSDASGNFTLSGLPVGEYVARVDLPAYLLKTQPFSVTSGGDASLPLVLTPKPKDASVTLTAKEVKIRDQIMFKTGSAEIDERSSPLLSEIADVLLRNPQAAHVQVQGHTDNIGDPEANLTLSQQRAEAVVQSLVSAGVGSDRLEAKGYGDSRPLVPNLTPGNRARNRRVQFIVKE
ncbi:MAG TPA: OmpA family protein [Polyangiales bacterium]|nr:OmpA family protein [Polyangiales bacterium]